MELSKNLPLTPLMLIESTSPSCNLEIGGIFVQTFPKAYPVSFGSQIAFIGPA